MPNGTWADVGTPDNPINVRMPDGTWKLMGGGDGSPMYVRNGQIWVQWTSGGLPTGNEFVYEYSAAYTLRTKRFIDTVGWEAHRELNYEYQRFQQQAPDFPTGVEMFGAGVANGLVSDARSIMGWVGDENNTWIRQRTDQVGWYSLPLGMFIDGAQTETALARINDPTGWAATANLLKVEVVHMLTGYSVQKSQMPWMNQYYLGNTTLGYWDGVGALRYQGPTPQTTMITTTWNDSVYTVPAVRNKPFARESSGEIIWTGDLNDLGVRDGIPNDQGIFVGLHGIPVTDAILVTQTFTPQLYDPDEGLQYHVQVSPLPDPVPIDFTKSYAIHNFMSDQFIIRVTYTY